MRTTLYIVGSSALFRGALWCLLWCALGVVSEVQAQGISFSEGLAVIERTELRSIVKKSSNNKVVLTNKVRYVLEGFGKLNEDDSTRYKLSLVVVTRKTYTDKEKLTTEYFIEDIHGPNKYFEIDNGQLKLILTKSADAVPPVPAVKEVKDDDGKVVTPATPETPAREEVKEVAIVFDSVQMKGYAAVTPIVESQFIFSDNVVVTNNNANAIFTLENDTTYSSNIKLLNHFRRKLYAHGYQPIFGVRGSVEASFMRSYANVAQFNKQEQLNIRGSDEAGIGFTVGGFVGMTGKGGSGFYVSADYWRHDVRLAGEQGVNLFTGLPASTDELNPDAVDSYAKFHSVLLGVNYFYTSRYRRAKPIFELGAYYQYNIDNSNEAWQSNDQGQIINNHFGLSTGLGINFHYFKAADFSLIPTFRYTFTSFNPDAEIASNNFGFGLKAQMTLLPWSKRW